MAQDGDILPRPAMKAAAILARHNVMFGRRAPLPGDRQRRRQKATICHEELHQDKRGSTSTAIGGTMPNVARGGLGACAPQLGHSCQKGWVGRPIAHDLRARRAFECTTILKRDTTEGGGGGVKLRSPRHMQSCQKLLSPDAERKLASDGRRARPTHGEVGTPKPAKHRAPPVHIGG